jgi:hypothetical protein
MKRSNESFHVMFLFEHDDVQIGGRRAIILYATVALGYMYVYISSVCGRNLDLVSSLQLITWFVPSVVGDAIAVSLIGLLLGPIYPLAMAHSGKSYQSG